MEAKDPNITPTMLDQPIEGMKDVTGDVRAQIDGSQVTS